MKIALPKSPAYYYECTGLARRLFYYLPPPSLRSLIKDKKAKATLLRDFPDGVEIAINEDDFRRFELGYGYQHPVPADALLNAFAAMLAASKDPDGFRGTGFINADSLEQTALALESDHGREEEKRPAIPSGRGRRPRAKLKKAKARPNLSFDEQSWSRVELTEGANPLRAFATLRKS